MEKVLPKDPRIPGNGILALTDGREEDKQQVSPTLSSSSKKAKTDGNNGDGAKYFVDSQ